MKAVVGSFLVLCMAATAGAQYQLIIDFEAPTYSVAPLPGQDGWAQIVGTDPAAASVVNTDNGPTLPGGQCVDLTNWVSEVRVEKAIADAVAAGYGIVTYQYDIKYPFNMLDYGDPFPFWSTSNFRVRLYGDDGAGNNYAPIGCHHYDGGGGPASTGWASSTPDGQTGGWFGPGGPPWLDQEWHTVSWTIDYTTNDFVGLTWDGEFIPHPGWWFYDWNGGSPGGIARATELLRMWLFTYDNNDYVKVDNIIITANPKTIIDFESPNYTAGMPLEGQDGWSRIIGSDPGSAVVSDQDNGPTLPGQQCLDLINWVSEIRVEKAIADAVAAGFPIVTLQYDLKDVFNLDTTWWSTTLFRARLYGDDGAGNKYAPVGNMHYDGGAGPANQAWVSFTPDGQSGGWGAGDPAWTDPDWHTVVWTFNYDTLDFGPVVFDGVEYSRDGEWFYDWNGANPGGIASATDLLRMWLMSYDNNDYWKIDNIIITSSPVEGACCQLDAACVITTEEECLAQGGAYQGDYSECTGFNPPCDYGQADAVITLEILTDDWGNETGWEVVEHGVGVVASVGFGTYGNNTLYTENVAVCSTSCYDVIIYDEWGDGIYDPGYYRVYYNGDLVGEGGEGAGGGWFSEETVADVGDGCGLGACCLDLAGTCVDTTDYCCAFAGGTFKGYGTDCADSPCVLSMDIKPGSCPNSFNRGSHGVLPVGLLGTADFDVTTVDIASLRISRADGIGGEVAPNEGPPGPHSVFEDVGTPFYGQWCDCHELTGDGVMDLSMKFRTDDVVAGLELYNLPAGGDVELVVSGTLLDGTPFTASDCVKLVPANTPPANVFVTSNVPGGWIDATPLDALLDGGGFADFERSYLWGETVTLTAETASTRPFAGWEINGVFHRGAPTVAITLDDVKTLRAVYRFGGISVEPRPSPVPERPMKEADPVEPLEPR